MKHYELAVLYGSDCTDRVEPALATTYSTFLELLWNQLRPDGSDEPSPELLIVHSPVARPMSVRSTGGSTLVYDQYLGQAFSRLTRLALCDAAPEVVDAYLLKLYGQRLLVRGRHLEAAAFAVVSKRLTREHGAEAVTESEEQLAFRSTSTTVQEAFAIAHELMHLVLDDAQVESDLRGMYSEVIAENIARVQRATEQATDAFHDQYLSDVENALIRRGLDPSHVKTGLAPQLVRGTDEVAERRSLLERLDVQLEGMCDLYGAIAVANILQLPGMDYFDVMASATLAVQHLRLIQILDQTAANEEEDVPGLELSQSIARTSLLRTGLGVSLSVSLQGEDEKARTALNKLHDKAKYLNRAHTTVVLDQLHTGLNLRLLTQRFLADEEIAGIAAGVAADEVFLRHLLGFHPVS